MDREPSDARIFQINRSDGGVPKLPTPSAMVTEQGLDGDRQRDKRNHGGPQRAICLYSLEQILALQAEGHPIYPGSTGENVTLSGVDLHTLAPGDRLALGDDVMIEITGYAHPCQNISGSFADGNSTRISQKLHPGESRLYARVYSGGELRPGLPVRVLERVTVE
jgi:MOSC domain-containing protein YiiM